MEPMFLVLALGPQSWIMFLVLLKEPQSWTWTTSSG